jgi:hypothetical protein
MVDPASTPAFQQAARKTRRIGLLVTIGVALFVLLVVGLPILFSA